MADDMTPGEASIRRGGPQMNLREARAVAAEEGTIRKMFADSIEENAIHGSDGEETAAFEIGYFFAGYELK